MSSAAIIDGKAFAANLCQRVAAAVTPFVALTDRKPGLAVVLVGEDPASQVYVGSKKKATVEAGMNSFEHRLPTTVSQNELIALVETLNADAAVDGIVVQLPLPPHIDDKAVIAAIDPAKDVDGFHVVNAGRLAVGEEAFVPCTPLGCLMLLKDHLGDLSHSRTQDLPDVVRRADIVVAAVGRAEMVTGDWLKAGAVVIDVGINRLEPEAGQSKGRLVGDVAFDDALARAGAITPVPGGVGPMTIACLLRNTLVAAYRRAGISAPEGI